ncbi:PadR family transcriptional regulator [candidate division KSB1 bacterium]
MEILTKLEELILLAVWKLNEEAYGVSIYKHLQKVTGQKMSVGSVYFPLDRLVKKRYLKAMKGEPTPKRGGMSKRYYLLTEAGLNILNATKKVNDTMWDGYSVLKDKKLQV